MSEHSLSNILNLYLFTVGRIAFAARQTQRIAASRGDNAIVQSAQTAVEAAMLAAEIKEAWKRTKNRLTGRGDGLAVVIDSKIDRIVTAIYRAPVNYLRSIDADERDEEVLDAAAKAKEVVELFPSGASSITNQNYEDQLASIDILIKRLEQDMKSHVEVLGIDLLIRRLKSTQEEYRTALEVVDVEETNWSQVKTSRYEAQERLLELVAHIVGTYRLKTEEHNSARSALLEPILFQNTRMGESYQNHKPVMDIDPDTGTEVPDEPVV